MTLPIKQREAELISLIGKVKRHIAQLEAQISDMIDYSIGNPTAAETVDEQIEAYDNLYESLNRLIIEKERLKRERLDN
jgi:hypothetical protein